MCLQVLLSHLRAGEGGGLSLGLQIPLQNLIQTGRQKPVTCTQSCLLTVTPRVPVFQLHSPSPRPRWARPRPGQVDAGADAPPPQRPEDQTHVQATP